MGVEGQRTTKKKNQMTGKERKEDERDHGRERNEPRRKRRNMEVGRQREMEKKEE